MRSEFPSNTRVGLMSGELLLATSPTGWLKIPPRLQAHAASLYRVDEKELVPRMTRLRPGELVLVVATPGKKMLVKRPPGSMVGTESRRYRPLIDSLWPRLWSIRIISCRELKMPRKGTNRSFPF